MNNPIQIVLPNGTNVELPSKYLKYSQNTYFCVTAENEVIMVDNSEESRSISKKRYPDIYLPLLLISEPISGAEFENSIEKTFNILYGKAV